jgi:hypothetical protein
MKPSKAPLDSRCAHCGTSIPYTETSRTFATPDGEVRLPQGSGWVVCGPRCPKLPVGAVVYDRGGWERTI